MSFGEKFKECLKQLVQLFRRSIGPMALFLIIYNLITSNLLFPIGRKIWSHMLTMLPDGYIAGSNMGDLIKHPIVPIVGIILIIIYAILSYLQIQIGFIFIEYRYRDKLISFPQLIKETWIRTGKILKPRNWIMLLFAVLIIPFVNLFQLSTDLGAVVVPEYILTVIQNKTPLFIAYSLVVLLLLYLVLKGLYIFITFAFGDGNFKDAMKESAALTRGFKNKGIKFLGLILGRIGAIIFFSAIPYLLLWIMNALSKLLFGKMESYMAARELLTNTLAVPVIEYFSVSMSCAVVISLITIWYHNDKKQAGDTEPELNDYEVSEGLKKLIQWMNMKSFTALLAACVIFYAVAVPAVSVYFRDNPEEIASSVNATLIIAHKGYTAKAPENTIKAMEVAISEGSANVVEFDVQATKDGVPVVIHDANANGLTGVDADIADLTLAEVKELRVSGEQIPTLEEWLIACDHRIALLLEIKNYNKDPNLESNIMELLKKYNYLDGSCSIHSGKVDSLKKIKEINPDMRCGLIMALAVGTFYDLPYADFFSVESSFINANMIEGINNRGKQVYVWTVDDEDSVKAFYYNGIDGIICDDPGAVRGYIDKYLGNVAEYAFGQLTKEISKYKIDLESEIPESMNTSDGD